MWLQYLRTSIANCSGGKAAAIGSPDGENLEFCKIRENSVSIDKLCVALSNRRSRPGVPTSGKKVIRRISGSQAIMKPSCQLSIWF